MLQFSLSTLYKYLNFTSLCKYANSLNWSFIKSVFHLKFPPQISLSIVKSISIDVHFISFSNNCPFFKIPSSYSCSKRIFDLSLINFMLNDLLSVFNIKKSAFNIKKSALNIKKSAKINFILYRYYLIKYLIKLFDYRMDLN